MSQEGSLFRHRDGGAQTTPSSDPHTAPRAPCPSVCCKVPSNFPTIQGVQNSNEIATAAELAIICTLSGLCYSLHYNQVPEIRSVLTESLNSMLKSGLKWSCSYCVWRTWTQYCSPRRLCFVERQQDSCNILQQTWRSFCLKS